MSRPKTGIVIECFFCGNRRYRSPSKIRHERAFCSERCHWEYIKKYELHAGEKNPAWSGGKHIDGRGYVRLRAPDHPLAFSNGYIKEHRFVAMQKIGRFLRANED